MLKIEYDLRGLTCEELIEMRDQMQHLIEDIEQYEHDRAVMLTEEEKHVIAQALAIDELSGEWNAGA